MTPRRFVLALLVLLGAAPATRAQIDFDYFGGLEFEQAIPTPPDALGYELGDHFTRHEEVVSYFRTLAAGSDRVRLEQYGTTNQRRPLLIVTISSPANLARLDEILERNRELTDPRTADPARLDETVKTNPTIVWLSYGVHGNEPSSSETAMQVAYTLAAGTNKEIRDILDTCVVVIDPCLNPDGRQRYVSWLESTVGRVPNPDPEAAEHWEPWPGGRTNHYLFDLNRDWLWMTQVESRQRIPMYRRYRPHLHVDYHEQEYRNPYFFGAGDSPYNANIPVETREWIELFGKANAEVFDREGVVYATKERFDYFYPGYGKVLPVYHGAVGLLCEKGGHSRGGLTIEFNDHQDLTLRARARDHFLTSMSYLETSADNRQRQLERFRRFFAGSIEAGKEHPATVFIRADNDPHVLAEMFRVLNGHGIEVWKLTENTTITGVALLTGQDAAAIEVPAGTFLIRTDQPMGRLARAVLEPDPELEDRDTYDITAWSMPVVFGLDGWWVQELIDAPSTKVESMAPAPGRVLGQGSTALIIDSGVAVFPRIIGLAAKRDVFARFAGEPIEIAEHRFETGSLIVHINRNAHADLDAFVDDVVAAGADVHRLGSTYADVGPSLGNNANPRFRLPKLGLVRGRPIDAGSFGAAWFLVDRVAQLPHTVLEAHRLGSADLDEYNVIIVPSTRSLDTNQTDAIEGWVQSGGTFLCVGSAAHWADRALLKLEADDEDDENDEDDASEDERPELSELTYEQRRQRGVDDRVPGPLVRMKIDTTHPLAAGIGEYVGVIKRDSKSLLVKDDGHVIARYADEIRVGGSISQRNTENLAGEPCVTSHRLGSGRVICIADDATFRGFQGAPARILLNAIIFGPSVP